ncbi:alkylhydroperoxidase [Paraburkholderia ginsengiterrae]|uniref:Alkylhydroperoxidase n=1 Tax=Paraburkholderia ginsengiterrae TaxID=1462993 RepID=A0A1A9N8J7_9BURK|nr:carboxymuconolactone decarboxylase family protein [Paraburkholderia ginsengiterrae]OAJ55358.1 alkylhydroperoxidase [Paraburkholderia ginsengiterrae]OAJ61383.1 alkylhydroperoxidase [Paraburkholderia ginsengiterrae]
MSRISIPDVASATGAVAEAYAVTRKVTGGVVPNLFAAIGALSPDVLNSYMNAEAVLGAGTLGGKDIETTKVVVSELNGCDYCVGAHVMLGKIVGLSPESLKQIRAGNPTGDAKRDALVQFVRLIQQSSGTITAEQFAAIKEAGYTDAQLVEIALAIALTVFTNTFNRFNDTTLDVPRAD